MYNFCGGDDFRVSRRLTFFDIDLLKNPLGVKPATLRAQVTLGRTGRGRTEAAAEIGPFA